MRSKKTITHVFAFFQQSYQFFQINEKYFDDDTPFPFSPFSSFLPFSDTSLFPSCSPCYFCLPFFLFGEHRRWCLPHGNVKSTKYVDLKLEEELGLTTLWAAGQNRWLIWPLQVAVTSQPRRWRPKKWMGTKRTKHAKNQKKGQVDKCIFCELSKKKFNTWRKKTANPSPQHQLLHFEGVRTVSTWTTFPCSSSQHSVHEEHGLDLIVQDFLERHKVILDDIKPSLHYRLHPERDCVKDIAWRDRDVAEAMSALLSQFQTVGPFVVTLVPSVGFPTSILFCLPVSHARRPRKLAERKTVTVFDHADRARVIAAEGGTRRGTRGGDGPPLLFFVVVPPFPPVRSFPPYLPCIISSKIMFSSLAFLTYFSCFTCATYFCHRVHLFISFSFLSHSFRFLTFWIDYLHIYIYIYLWFGWTHNHMFFICFGNLFLDVFHLFLSFPTFSFKFPLFVNFVPLSMCSTVFCLFSFFLSLKNFQVFQLNFLSCFHFVVHLFVSCCSFFFYSFSFIPVAFSSCFILFELCPPLSCFSIFSMFYQFSNVS